MCANNDAGMELGAARGKWCGRGLSRTLIFLAMGLAAASVGGSLLAADAAHATLAAHAKANGASFEWGPFLAPFHVVLLHYPIGFLTMAFLVELYRLWRPSPEVARISAWVMFLSLLSGAAAATLGIMRASNGGYSGRSLDLHRWLGIAVPVLTLFTWVLLVRFNRDARSTAMKLGYRTLLLLTLGVMVIGGHYGGNLTHGSKFLVANAPTFIRHIMDEEAWVGGPQDEKSEADIGARLYAEKIRPILETKCVSCHGPDKQEAKYRIDRRDMAYLGGESTVKAIKPHDPFKSNIVRLILLPQDDMEVMPPAGKEGLKPEEIISIVRWIQLGAPYPSQEPRTGKLADSAGTKETSPSSVSVRN